MKDLNFLAGKDITWIEKYFEPIPKGYILGKDDVICDMPKLRKASYSGAKISFFTNLSLAYGENPEIYNRTLRYNYDIYDVKFNENGNIVGSYRKKHSRTEKYPVFHNRYEYTLHHRNFYMFKQSIPKFINWTINPLED